MKKTYIIFLLFFLLLLPWEQVYAKSSVVITKVIVGEGKLKAGKIQLVEITLRNKSKKKVAVSGQLSITLPNGKKIRHGKKRIEIRADTETNLLIPYWVNKKMGGRYLVRALLYDSRGRRLSDADPAKKSARFTAIGPLPKVKKSKKKKAEEAQERKKVPSPPPVITFEPPDLSWTRSQILKINALRGEGSNVRLSLLNDGGDIAENVEFSVSWFYVARPNRKVSIFKNTIPFLAPGEKKLFEIPFTIPSDEPKGKYKIFSKADGFNQVRETNEDNNEIISENDLLFDDITLRFPDNQHSFAEDGLFFFKWKSTRYNQFKVEISTDASFADPENQFEIPQGDKWTPSFTITPLGGELPIMGRALMDSAEVEFLYWRVLALDSNGKKSESESRRFFINVGPTQQ